MALTVTSAPFQQVNMPALDLRRFMSSVVSGEGVLGSTDMTVAQRAAGTNMSVDIAAGQALVKGDTVTNQGYYYAYNDATVNLAVGAAHATNPRIDRVALRVRDAFHGDAANDEAFVVVAGTATSGATLANLTGAAAVPGGHLLLANILVPAAATTVTTANIGNARSRVGGELAYNEFTGNVGTNNTTEATAGAVVTASAFTFDGSTPVMIEFFATGWEHSLASTRIWLWLYDGSTSLGRLAVSTSAAAAATAMPPLMVRRRMTPTAAAHTYSVRLSTDAGLATIYGGTAGTGSTMPGFIRITRA